MPLRKVNSAGEGGVPGATSVDGAGASYGVRSLVGCIPFGCAHTEVAVITPGDLYLLSALERNAHIQSGHGTVEINVVTRARALHYPCALRMGDPWQCQAKKCGYVLRARLHFAPAGPKC